MQTRRASFPLPLLRWTALAATILSSACGGSQATAASTTPAAEPPPSVPDEPLQLVPANATQLLRIDVAQLRGWSEYPRLSPLVGAADCQDGPKLLELLGRVDRIAIAGLPREAAGPDGLIVAHGEIDDELKQQVLDAMAGSDAAPRTEPKRSTIGRFEVLSDGRAAVAVLDGKVLVIGGPAAVEAALGLAAAEPPGAGSILATERVEALGLTEHAVGGFVMPSSQSAREIKRTANRFGGPKLGEALADATTGFRLQLSEGVRVEVRSELASQQLAGDLMGRIQQMAAQATMFLRMFRLPPLQERLDVSIDDRTLVVVLELPPNEVARVSALAETTFKPPACPDKPAAKIAAPAAPAAPPPGGGGGAP